MNPPTKNSKKCGTAIWKQPRRANKTATENSAHFIGELLALRREMPNNKQFSAHIIQRGWLSGGVGLVLWYIKEHSETQNGVARLNLSSRFAEKLVPRAHGDKSITALLREADILHVEVPAVWGQSSARYKLADSWRGVIPRNFKLNDWQKKRLQKAHGYAAEAQLVRSPWLAWVDETLCRTELPETDALREAMQNENTRPATERIMGFLRGYEPPHKRKKTKVQYCGMVYTPILSLPCNVVCSLLIDGEPVSYLDITAAYPSTLPSLMVDAEKKFQIAGAIMESKKLADELETGKLYETLGLEIGMESKTAKTQLLAAFNGKDNHTYNSKVFQAFVKKFPVAKKVISNIRKRGHTNLHKKMSVILANAMKLTLETLFKFEIPAFPITDAIVCRKKDEAFVREVLSAYFLDQTGVHALVGKKRVSFLPDGFMEKPHCESLRTPRLSNAE